MAKSYRCYVVEVEWRGANADVRVHRNADVVEIEIPALMPSPLRLTKRQCRDLRNALETAECE